MRETDAVLVGRYRLVQQIGAGGMGVVWRAFDERLGRDVAVKRLHTRPGLDPAQAEVWSHRAMREARITARLHHPHAVPVFDVVEHDGQPCLVMQYFPSRSLAELLADRGRMPVPEVARIGAEVGSALATAHRAGIVHRDVKPANVLVGPDGLARITDFGIAHAVGDVSLTTTGMVTGTPAYLAPEVARGGDASTASDVFSLGSTLYAALEGHPPFGTSENAMALVHRVAAGDVVPPQHAGVLGPLLVRMLAVDPASRPSMDDVAAELSAPADADDTPLAATPAVPTAEPSGLDLLWPRRDEPPRPTEPPRGDPPVPEAVPAPGGGPGRTRRSGLLVALGVLAVVAALAFGLPALQDDRDGVAEPTRAAAAPSGAAAASPTASPAGPSAPATTSTSQSPSPSPSAPARSASPTSQTPTAGELSGAVEDYYALLPGGLDAAWDRLTTRYQGTTAKDRDTFESFWGGVERVRATDVDGSRPATVTATVTYDFDDGRTFVERTRYRLVRDGGVLKVDRSEVLSSRQE